jgi:AcrR family transcriptional regulator
MGLRASKKERTRTEILETAEARFRADGFEGTSIRAIAAEVPVSVQTLYNYFPSKEGILAAIAADRFQAMAAVAEKMRVEFLESGEAEGTPVDRFLQLVRWGLVGISKDREFMQLVFLNARDVLFGSTLRNRAVESSLSDELHARQVENDRVLLRMFEGMQKSGAIRDDVDPSEVADLYVLIFTERVARWLRHPDSTLDALEASVISGLEIVFRGAAP